MAPALLKLNLKKTKHNKRKEKINVYMHLVMKCRRGREQVAGKIKEGRDLIQEGSVREVLSDRSTVRRSRKSKRAGSEAVRLEEGVANE